PTLLLASPLGELAQAPPPDPGSHPPWFLFICGGAFCAALLVTLLAVVLVLLLTRQRSRRRCPGCGAIVAKGAARCWDCGSDLPDGGGGWTPRLRRTLHTRARATRKASSGRRPSRPARVPPGRLTSPSQSVD